MLFKLLILFVALPLIELALLLRIAEAIGGWETFWLVVITGIAGGFFTRREGARTFQRIQRQLHANRIPTEEIVAAFLVFAAGLLLLTPGILTDIAGFCMLIPPLRKWTAGFALNFLKRRIHFSAFPGREGKDKRYSSHYYQDDNTVIDVTAEEIEDDENDSR